MDSFKTITQNAFECIGKNVLENSIQTKMRTVRNGRFSTDDFNLMAHLYHF